MGRDNELMPSSNEATTRVLERAQPRMRMRMRIVSGPTQASGSHGPAWVHVEWAGRVGHPSSYGLLGGTRVDKSVVRIQPSGASSETRSLPGQTTSVGVCSPSSRQQSWTRCSRSLRAFFVSLAAHGAIGSSPYVFARLARFLGCILATDVAAEDAEVWRLFDQVWSDPSLR